MHARLSTVTDGQVLAAGEFSRHLPIVMTPAIFGCSGLELTADPELVDQVLINLLVNATHALEARADARIELSARLDGRGHVLIEVADNGPGIVEEAMEKIFIPFFTTKQDGSGIGLSLSRQIMRLHRGNISVRSEPGEATVFTLKF